MHLRLLLTLALVSTAAHAEPVEVNYAAYAAGLNVLRMTATFDVEPTHYRVRLEYRTTGTFGVFMHAQQSTTVEGQFVAGKAVPQRFYSSGVLRGAPRLTAMEYVGGHPAIRQLTPPSEQERELVPVEQQRGTIDTLSAMAQLVRQVVDTGRCEGQVMTFDGRRLAELSAHTVGTEFLPPSSTTSYTGNALHCSFDGQQLAGFKLDEDRAQQQKPQRGSAWFAPTAPGRAVIPVRIVFHTRWFGDATMFIVDKPE